jgi:hypothetical protein
MKDFDLNAKDYTLAGFLIDKSICMKLIKIN